MDTAACLAAVAELDFRIFRERNESVRLDFLSTLVITQKTGIRDVYSCTPNTQLNGELLKGQFLGHNNHRCA